MLASMGKAVKDMDAMHAHGTGKKIPGKYTL